MGLYVGPLCKFITHVRLLKLYNSIYSRATDNPLNKYEHVQIHKKMRPQIQVTH